MNSPGTEPGMDGYVGQIERMARRARDWRKANPDKVVMVQFNFPNNTMFIATFNQAVERGAVSVNEAGREIVQAMHDPEDPRGEPTVTMVRFALELEGNQTAHHPKHECPHCGAKLNYSTCLDGANEPEPGDLSVCIACAGLLEFQLNGFNVLTDAMLEALPDETRNQLTTAQQMVQNRRKHTC